LFVFAFLKQNKTITKMLCLTGLSDSLSREHRMWHVGQVILHDVDTFTCVLEILN